jgi:hypothetical protein
MYKPVQIKGQFYTNRVRKNVAKIMEERGMSGSKGLPHMSSAGLYKFMSGGADITMTRVQMIADDLGVSVPELLQYAD